MRPADATNWYWRPVGPGVRALSVTPDGEYRPPVMLSHARVLLTAALVGLLTLAGGLGGAALLGGVASSPAPTPAPLAAAPSLGGTPEASSPALRGDPSPAIPAVTQEPPAAAQPIRSPALRATPQLVARLDALLESLRVEHGLPGVSATIIFPDGSTWTATSGMADVKRGTPVRDDTAFALASISKTFTAAVVLDLVAEGRLSLEERVARRLPGLGIDARVTVRQLLDHTSGLHDFFLNPSIDPALLKDRAADWTTKRSLRYVSKPYFKPGRGWHYSNTNYVLLGLVAEEVTGESLASQIRRRYLDPLGLTTAYYQGVEEPRGTVAHGYRFESLSDKARPIDLSDGTAVVPFRSVVSASDGAGSMAASSSDVARWARALYRGQATRPETLAMMLGGVYRVDGLKTAIPYGLGVQAIRVDGFPTYGHAGRFMGSRGLMRWLAGYDVTIVVLTNQSRVDPSLLALSLLELAVPKPDPCGVCPIVS
jgi:D-alanyl-D-alanine carboxypeptidase